jgi:hypothetical protein
VVACALTHLPPEGGLARTIPVVLGFAACSSINSSIAIPAAPAAAQLLSPTPTFPIYISNFRLGSLPQPRRYSQTYKRRWCAFQPATSTESGSLGSVRVCNVWLDPARLHFILFEQLRGFSCWRLPKYCATAAIHPGQFSAGGNILMFITPRSTSVCSVQFGFGMAGSFIEPRHLDRRAFNRSCRPRFD